MLTIRQVFDLAAAADQRYRALILLAVFGSLRWGELAALRRRHIDLATGAVRVAVSVVELTGGSLVTGPPTSRAGQRTVTIPAFTGATLRELMERMGHSTTRAALIYQHRSIDRDQLIAAAMSKLAEAELQQINGGPGTQRARSRNEEHRR
ncbi:MAG TPA: hypothetical protein VKV80_00345 [Streptosporangiaceae bacterium]|nr:hypothetical protein [Streptosporangiaceae bacterium]